MQYCNRSVYINPNGYPMIKINGKTIYPHRLEWEHYNGSIPKGMYIHHKNNDKLDWSIENLALISPLDHNRLHAGWIMENDKWTKKPCTKCNRILLFDKFYKKLDGVQAICIECKRKTDVYRIVPNENGQYKCFKCQQWKSKKSYYLRNEEIKSTVCKDCINKRRGEHRRKKGMKRIRKILPNEEGKYECSTCKEFKDKKLFYITKRGSPASYCRECFNKRYRERRRILHTTKK